MMKMRTRAALAAVTGAMASATLVAAAPAPAGAACLPQWETTVALTLWENENWERNDPNIVIDEGVLVTSGGEFSRPNGWTPIRAIRAPGGGWVSILSGPNDSYDFIRTSGLKYRGCS